jgi:hypothetical protein
VIPFAIPIAVIAIAAGAYNYARFGSPGEFGHNFLDVVQQQQMERYGLFSYHYLERNLAVAFTLLPEIPEKGPFVQVSGHGLAIWVAKDIPIAGHEIALTVEQRQKFHSRPASAAVMRELERV